MCSVCQFAATLGLRTVEQLRSCRPFLNSQRLLSESIHLCEDCGEVFLIPALLHVHWARWHSSTDGRATMEMCPRCHFKSYYPWRSSSSSTCYCFDPWQRFPCGGNSLGRVPGNSFSCLFRKIKFNHSQLTLYASRLYWECRLSWGQSTLLLGVF